MAKSIPDKQVLNYHVTPAPESTTARKGLAWTAAACSAIVWLWVLLDRKSYLALPDIVETAFFCAYFAALAGTFLTGFACAGVAIKTRLKSKWSLFAVAQIASGIFALHSTGMCCIPI